MKKLLFLCFFIVLAFTKLVNGDEVYFISLSGSDNGEGNENNPWRTVEYAVKQLRKGDTLIFDDGTYIINKAIEIENLHSENSPTVLKAKRRGNATLLFDSAKVLSTKMTVRNSSNIEVNGLILTSTAKNIGNTHDILLAIRNCKDVAIIDNTFKNAFEEGLKVSTSKNISVINNLFFDFDHEGIDFLNVENSIVQNNTLKEIGRVGIMVKGGSDDVMILNNLIINTLATMRTAGITIGGMTGFESTKSYKKGAYEAYNIVAANNKVLSKPIGKIINGVAFFGAKNCHLINNTFIGVSVGIYLKRNNSKSYGWVENVNNRGINLLDNKVFNPLVKDIVIIDRPESLMIGNQRIASSNRKFPQLSNQTRRSLNEQVINLNRRKVYLSDILKEERIGADFN